MRTSIIYLFLTIITFSCSSEENTYPQNTGSYLEDILVLKKILRDNPNNSLDWQLNEKDPLNPMFAGTDVVFSDINGEKRLTILSCMNGNITNLDVSGATQLEELYCIDNTINSLNLSKNRKLKALDCSNNNIEHLDVSGATQLQELYCSNTLISNLDISSNKQLQILSCHSNKFLNTLYLLNNDALESLNCLNSGFTDKSIKISSSRINNIKNIIPEKENHIYDIISKK